jgi:hypothetical protein
MYTLLSIFLLIWVFIAYKNIINKNEHGIIVTIVIPIFSIIVTGLICLIITYLP